MGEGDAVALADGAEDVDLALVLADLAGGGLGAAVGGDQPDLPPDVLFSELEIQVLKAFAAQHGIDPPETLAAAALLVARIGGHIHRPRGPPPGTKVMWRGTATLAGMCLGYRLAMENQQ